MMVNVNHRAIDRLMESPEVVAMLGQKAQAAASGVNAPSSMTKYTRAGVGPRGAFSQIVVSGSGSIAWEWGSVNNPPAGQLRAALNRVR